MNYLSEVAGEQSVARVVARSLSLETNTFCTTLEIETPRLIWSEFMTHGAISKNAASSRAIPVKKMIDLVRDNPAMPVRFGQNQSGMQDKGVEHDGRIDVLSGAFISFLSGREYWKESANSAANYAERLYEAGYHKQICNRIIEPYQYIKAVVSFTGEGANFFGLRNHPDADPTIADLAVAMYHAIQSAEYTELREGDWHMPYYKDGAFIKGRDKGLQKALKLSASCCAQVSYRVLDDSQEKADKVFERLIESKPVHASPTEHQAICLKKGVGFRSKYVTHIDRNGNLGSGRFWNWGQHRQVIEGNVIRDENGMY